MNDDRSLRALRDAERYLDGSLFRRTTNDELYRCIEIPHAHH